MIMSEELKEINMRTAAFSTAKSHVAAAKYAKTQIEFIDIDDIEYTFCYGNGSKCWYAG